MIGFSIESLAMGGLLPDYIRKVGDLFDQPFLQRISS